MTDLQCDYAWQQIKEEALMQKQNGCNNCFIGKWSNKFSNNNQSCVIWDENSSDSCKINLQLKHLLIIRYKNVCCNNDIPKQVL